MEEETTGRQTVVVKQGDIFFFPEFRMNIHSAFRHQGLHLDIRRDVFWETDGGSQMGAGSEASGSRRRLAEALTRQAMPGVYRQQRWGPPLTARSSIWVVV